MRRTVRLLRIKQLAGLITPEAGSMRVGALESREYIDNATSISIVISGAVTRWLLNLALEGSRICYSHHARHYKERDVDFAERHDI